MFSTQDHYYLTFLIFSDNPDQTFKSAKSRVHHIYLGHSLHVFSLTYHLFLHASTHTTNSLLKNLLLHFSMTHPHIYTNNIQTNDVQNPYLLSFPGWPFPNTPSTSLPCTDIVILYHTLKSQMSFSPLVSHFHLTLENDHLINLLHTHLCNTSFPLICLFPL